MFPAGELLRNPNYRIYFVGLFISLTGTWAQSVALSWLVYRITGSSYSVGLIAFSSQIPAFLLSPFAGAIADRFERKKIFIIVQWAGMLQASLLTALIFSGIEKLWAILILSTLLGCVSAFEITTRHALAVDIVDRSNLQGAIALNSALMNITRIIGPALAGTVINAFGEKWCFLYNAISYLGILISLSQMTFRPSVISEKQTAVWKSVRDGFDYIAQNTRMVRILVAATVLSAISASYNVLLPVYSKKVLSGSSDLFALLTSVGAIGAVLGAVSIGNRVGVRRTLRSDLTRSFLWIGVSIFVFGLSKHWGISLCCAMLFGFNTIRSWPLMNNALQQAVDDQMRGRVMGTFNMTFLGATPIAGLAAGWIGDKIGARNVLIATAIVAMISGIFLFVQGRSKPTISSYS